MEKAIEEAIDEALEEMIEDTIEEHQQVAESEETEDEMPEKNADESGGIFKLNIDCFRELFEFLPLKTICSLRETCKYLKQTTDHCIELDYPAVKFGCGKIEISDNSNDQLRRIDSSDFEYIKCVNISMSKLKKTQIQCFQPILAHVEIVDLDIAKFYGNFYKDFLKSCANIKSLRISNVDGRNIIKGSGSKWLHRHYPNLEHIVLNDRNMKSYRGKEISELKKFFELNPNIHTFSTTFNFLWKNRHWLKKSKITFDQLDLEVDYLFEQHTERVCGLVNELFQLGLYRRLHFYGSIIHDDDMNEIVSMPALEKVNLRYIDTSRNSIPPTLICLKELSFMDEEDFRDLDTLASNLVNVERIHISKTTINGILPFVRRSPNLMRIRVNCLSEAGGKFFENGFIDVRALDNERQQLAGACILTIYVEESIFLHTKHLSPDMVTECTLVQLKRVQAYEWTHQFN